MPGGYQEQINASWQMKRKKQYCPKAYYPLYKSENKDKKLKKGSDRSQCVWTTKGTNNV